jgi:5-methylcytosine-specific restriction endonuclease McrA
LDLASNTPAPPQLDPQLVKTCTKCGETKPLSEFSLGARYADGHYCQCKKCRNQFAVKYYKADPEKYCKRSRDWYWENHELALENMASWRAENPEAMKLAVANWVQENPESARIRGAKRRALLLVAPGRGVTVAQWLQVLADAQGICAYCHEPGKLTMDHVVPLVLGGAHDIDNIAAACGPCNSSKRDALLSDWLPKREQRVLLA